ncbi:MAG: topoisomerase C-terminal repeat-containing protein [Caldilineaceae bacterium]
MQLGDEGEGKSKKPKRVSLLKGMKPEEVDLDLAQKLLSLPRPLGAHPESGKEVRAGVGRFGPFVVHDGTFVSIKPPDHVLEIELARALELLAAKPEKRGSSKKVLKDLGEHPDGGAVQVLDGRYGPYVNHKRTNASLPENVDPQSVTMEQAVQMLSEKKTKKKGGRRKS